jgi:hypothetical protein
MSSGRRRLRRSQREPRSISRRPASSISTCTLASTLLSSASISPHCGRISKTSRAAAYARAISDAGAPLSSWSRKVKVVPPPCTTLLTTCVAMISRRSRCARMRSPKRSGSGSGK